MHMAAGHTTSSFSTGTVIMGVTNLGGVVLGATDSRTGTEKNVSNKMSWSSNKITRLTDNIYFSCSGSAADSQIVSDYIRFNVHRHKIQHGQLAATVKVVANLVRSYNDKNMRQFRVIVGGRDKYEEGKIYGILPGGTILEQPFASEVSVFSPYTLSAMFTKAWREGMSQEEAEQLVVKAVSLGIAPDGVVRTVTINSRGVSKNIYPADKLALVA